MKVSDYRRMLGTLLLLAVAPLPFLYIILPPFWLVAAAAGLLLVLRPTFNLRLSGVVLNLVGVGIIVAVVLAGGLRVGPLRPLGHLMLLLTTVRAVGVTDRRSFLKALLPVFLVWMISVTSSTDISVVGYFVVSAILWWWAGTRIHLAGQGCSVSKAGRPLPRPRHVAVAAVAALLIAIPIFLIMPRLRAPWIAGRGGVSSVTGFSSHVELGGVGTIRQSPEVALILRSVSGEPLETNWVRMRATALERVTLDSWAPRGASVVPASPDGLVWPFGRIRSLADLVELEVELPHPRRYLFLPEGTVAVSSPVSVRLDPTGGVVLASRMRGPLTYSVWVARGDPPRPADPPRKSSKEFEVHPGVRKLARDIVSGYETDVARAAAVERYLQQNFSYSMSGMTHLRSDPVAWFLLSEKQGHCEYFAGAMVALLDDLGIPARLVAGYSGGSLSLDGELAVVREANAHTWVEARVGHGEEWTTFDPTPEADVPALSRPTGRERIRWAMSWVQSAWDRYVLTFGLGEQTQLLAVLAAVVDFFFRHFEWRSVGLVLVGVAAAVFLWRFMRNREQPSPAKRPPAASPAARSIDRIARRLGKNGIDVPQRATVRWIARHARRAWPGAGAAVGELAWLAERELYSSDGPGNADRAVVRTLWKSVRHAMRQSSGLNSEFGIRNSE